MTATTVFDSCLFRDAFGTPDMRAAFAERKLIARYIEIEVALAETQAECGVIPAHAAAEIARCCDAAKLDFDTLRADALARVPEVTAHFDRDAIDRLTDPRQLSRRGAGEGRPCSAALPPADPVSVH